MTNDLENCPVSKEVVNINVRPFSTWLCGTVGLVSTITTVTAWSLTWRRTTRLWSTSSATSPTWRGVCLPVNWGKETSQASSTDRY